MVIDGFDNATQELLFIAKRRKLASKLCQRRERMVLSPVERSLERRFNALVNRTKDQRAGEHDADFDRGASCSRSVRDELLGGPFGQREEQHDRRGNGRVRVKMRATPKSRAGFEHTSSLRRSGNRSWDAPSLRGLFLQFLCFRAGGNERNGLANECRVDPRVLRR
jgi:hypothetical protein